MISGTFEDLLPQSDQADVRSALDNLREVAVHVVANGIQDDVVIAYSSGIDSSILAELVRRQRGRVKMLTMGTLGSDDVKAATVDALSRSDGFDLDFGYFDAKEIQHAAYEVAKVVYVDNLSHFEDCLSFWLTASTVAKRGDERCILSANGPDELFCGYDRFRRILDDGGYNLVDNEILKALDAAKKLGSQVARVVSGFGLEVKEPFMHESFRKFALSLPAEYKIVKGNDLLRKRIWRCLGRTLGIPEPTVMRRKKAMQYGTGIHSVVLSMLKKDLIKLPLGNGS